MPTWGRPRTDRDATGSVDPHRRVGRVVAQSRYGGPDVLQVSVRSRPEPAAGEVLVRVHAASVNARDWHMMRGEPRVARLMEIGRAHV